MIQKVFYALNKRWGIRNIKDIEKRLNSGADKVCINTEVIKNPKFLSEAKNFWYSMYSGIY